MTPKTEGQHTGEYLVSEGNGAISREEGILKSGETVVDGQALQMSSTKLVAAAGTLDTEGALDSDVVGIAYGDYDASAGDVSGVVYIARLAEVKDELLTYPTETTEGGEKAAVVASLAKLFIITR